MAVLTRRLPMALLALTLGFVSSTALADHDSGKKSGNTIVDKLVAIDGAQALVAAVLVVDEALGAGIADLLSNKRKKFTLFAPSNAAFEKLLGLEPGFTNNKSIGEIKTALGGLGLDPAGVAGILLKHVADGKMTAGKLLKKGKVEVADGSVFPVSIGATGVSINYETTLIQRDVWARNGIIHFIDTVIVDAGSN